MKPHPKSRFWVKDVRSGRQVGYFLSWRGAVHAASWFPAPIILERRPDGSEEQYSILGEPVAEDAKILFVFD